jgi:hypothetical protein
VRRTAGTAALALAAILAGCAWLGPEIIRSGRPAYNDAILTTNDEQLLQNIVRMRFGDSVGFLTVSSVTANVSFTTTGTVNVGLGGPPANYQGNLVPFAGTMSTEQNPTISYTPVSGDSLVRQFAAEIPLDLAILMINFAHSQEAAWMALVRRVNNLRNPDFPDPPALVTDARFLEIASLVGARCSGAAPSTGYGSPARSPVTGWCCTLLAAQLARGGAARRPARHPAAGARRRRRGDPGAAVGRLAGSGCDRHRHAVAARPYPLGGGGYRA